jgi:hypothetical protein
MPRKVFEYSTQALAAAELEEFAPYRDPEHFVNRALESTFLSIESERSRILALPRGASVLAPFAGGDEFTPELGLGSPGDDGEPLRDEGLVGDELLLAPPDSHVGELERSRPIDAEPVVELLLRLGFLSAHGSKPAIDDITGNEFTEFVLDDTAVATTLASRGRLRAVQLSSIRAYPVPWAELVGEFTALGERIGAKLAREDEF